MCVWVKERNDGGNEEGVEGKSLNSHVPPLPPLPRMRLLPVTTTATIITSTTTTRHHHGSPKGMCEFNRIHCILSCSCTDCATQDASVSTPPCVQFRFRSLSIDQSITLGIQHGEHIIAQPCFVHPGGAWGEISPNRISLSSPFDSKCLMTRFIDFILYQVTKSVPSAFSARDCHTETTRQIRSTLRGLHLRQG